jgi:hypothetical protein
VKMIHANQPNIAGSVISGMCNIVAPSGHARGQALEQLCRHFF